MECFHRAKAVPCSFPYIVIAVTLKGMHFTDKKVDTREKQVTSQSSLFNQWQSQVSIPSPSDIQTNGLPTVFGYTSACSCDKGHTNFLELLGFHDVAPDLQIKCHISLGSSENFSLEQKPLKLH